MCIIVLHALSVLVTPGNTRDTNLATSKLSQRFLESLDKHRGANPGGMGDSSPQRFRPIPQ